MGTWDTLVSLSNELDTVCSVRKLLVPAFVHTAQFLFLLFLCQKEQKFERVVALSVAWLLGKFPGGLGRFLPCSVGRHISHSVIWAGNNVPMG